MASTQTERYVRASLERTLQGWDGYSAEEYAAVSQAVRDQAVKKNWALSDGSYPIMNVGMLKAAARLAASGHGDVTAAMALIKRRAKDLGVKLSSLVGFAGSEKAADAHDIAVTRAIEDAIRLQESDPDQDANDSKVLASLKAALAAQRSDNNEVAKALCPTCGQPMPGGGY